jgi:hypothetical protein
MAGMASAAVRATAAKRASMKSSMGAADDAGYATHWMAGPSKGSRRTEALGTNPIVSSSGEDEPSRTQKT